MKFNLKASLMTAATLATFALPAVASASTYQFPAGDTASNRYGVPSHSYYNVPNEDQGEQYTSTGRIVRVLGVKDWSQNSWNNEGQKVYNFTAELGEQMPESSDFLGKYNYEGNIRVDGMEFRFWSIKH